MNGRTIMKEKEMKVIRNKNRLIEWMKRMNNRIRRIRMNWIDWKIVYRKYRKNIRMIYRTVERK